MRRMAVAFRLHCLCSLILPAVTTAGLQVLAMTIREVVGIALILVQNHGEHSIYIVQAEEQRQWEDNGRLKKTAMLKNRSCKRPKRSVTPKT